MNKYIKINKEFTDGEIIDAANYIKNGNVVVFPTETVYGIGVNAFCADAVKKIFEAKGRPQDNPLIVHISNLDMLQSVTCMEKITDIEWKLINAFFPGPFTLILPKNDKIPYEVTANLETVGIRMPTNIVANRLIELSGVPIAAPSANISGKPSGTKIEDIYVELKDKVDYIIDYGDSDIGIESTVAKVINGKVCILRPGKITKEDIETVVGNCIVEYDDKLFSNQNKNNKVESPGMKYKHYAPSTKCVLVYSENEEKMINKIHDVINEYRNDNVCVIGFNEHKCFFKTDLVEYINLGSKLNLLEISKNIFTALRKVDKLKPSICIVEGVKKEGIGISIMNRLIRAVSHNYIEI